MLIFSKISVKTKNILIVLNIACIRKVYLRIAGTDCSGVVAEKFTSTLNHLTEFLMMIEGTTRFFDVVPDYAKIVRRRNLSY